MTCRDHAAHPPWRHGGHGVHRPAARPPWRPRPAPPEHRGTAPRRGAQRPRGTDGPRPGGGTGLWGMGGFGTLAGMRHACRALVCSVGPPPPRLPCPSRQPARHAARVLFFDPPSLTPRTCYVSRYDLTRNERDSLLSPQPTGPRRAMVAVGRAVGEGAPPPIGDPH